MKKRDRYKIITYAVNQYRDNFEEDYIPVKLSKKTVRELLKEYNFCAMDEWYFCCYGWKTNCWVEPIEVGNWDMTAEYVTECIVDVVNSCRRVCRRDPRAYIYRRGEMITLCIIMRDRDFKCDYLITFYNDDQKEQTA